MFPCMAQQDCKSWRHLFGVFIVKDSSGISTTTIEVHASSHNGCDPVYDGILAGELRAKGSFLSPPESYLLFGFWLVCALGILSPAVPQEEILLMPFEF